MGTAKEVIAKIQDAPAIVTEIARPSKIAGYLAYIQNSVSPKWSEVHPLPNSQSHPVLPYYAFESRNDAIKAATEMKWMQAASIKIVAVEFEI